MNEALLATLVSQFLFHGICEKRGIPKAFGTPTSEAEPGVAHFYVQDCSNQQPYFGNNRKPHCYEVVAVFLKLYLSTER